MSVQFKDDVKTGQGTYTYADGSTYVGAFKDDKKRGQGTYRSPDGSEYVGEWQDGVKSGQGTYSFANGTAYVGAWKNDLFNGSWHVDARQSEINMWVTLRIAKSTVRGRIPMPMAMFM